MKVTHYDSGVPNWADLGSPDLAAAKQFYAGVFGWDPQEGPPEAGGYTIFHQDGAATAAVGPQQSPDQPPAWTIYMANVMEQGRLAIFMDPSGAVFGVWQPGAFPGAQVKDEPGALSWVELATRDPDGAAQFYRTVFGWQPDVQDMEGTPYTVFRVGERGVAGMMPMTGDQWPADLPAHWMPYFGTADTDATAAKIQELGGSVSVPPVTVPDVGRFAVVGDPAGAYFSIISEVGPAA
jgi:predicted enzyme related to lactoylglutathione lyase